MKKCVFCRYESFFAEFDPKTCIFFSFFSMQLQLKTISQHLVELSGCKFDLILWANLTPFPPSHAGQSDPASAPPANGSGGHRPSIFDAARRPSLSPIPTSGNPVRRLSNLSASFPLAPPPPTLMLPSGSDRRLSVFNKQVKNVICSIFLLWA